MDSIRFSLLEAIDRFYKVFSQRKARTVRLAIIPYAKKAAVWRSDILASLLPPEEGAPKGRRLAHAVGVRLPSNETQ